MCIRSGLSCVVTLRGAENVDSGVFTMINETTNLLITSISYFRLASLLMMYNFSETQCTFE